LAVFVHNATGLRARLKRSSIQRPTLPLEGNLAGAHDAPDELFLASVTIHERYVHDGARLWLDPGEHPRELESAFDAPLTNGTSVTASGVVDGSTSAVLARRVRLVVGPDLIEVVCRGPRQWRTVRGQLLPSEPTPFEPFKLGWEHAFGGRFVLPPGVDPESGLPQPGGELPHPMNPMGMGYAPGGRYEEGMPLPRVELLADQLSAVGQEPIPGGLGPACDLPGMRWRIPYDPRTQLPRSSHSSPFFIHHSAPFYLVFDTVLPGTRVQVLGFSGGEVQHEVPRPRSRVRWEGADGATGTRLRAVHLDLEQGALHLLVQHTLVMRKRLPRAALITEATP
jgi:hypothetical protein